jgi:hypothetical protein
VFRVTFFPPPPKSLATDERSIKKTENDPALGAAARSPFGQLPGEGELPVKDQARY